MRRGANQSTDNRPDCGSSECDPSGIAAVMDVVNDMMPRRWRRAMQTMPPMMRRGIRRTSHQNHPSHENRECLDDLVHITPTFLDFLSLHKARNTHRQNLTKTFIPPHSPALSSLFDFNNPHPLSSHSRRPLLSLFLQTLYCPCLLNSDDSRLRPFNARIAILRPNHKSGQPLE